MTRRFAFLLIGMNIVAIAIAIYFLSLVHRGHPAIQSAELEQRLARRLNSVTTPAEMQNASAHLVSIIASSNTVVHNGVILLDEALEFLIFMAVLNVTFGLLGVWQARKHVATPPV